MLDYPSARAVVLVVQTGSFEGAAKALHVTPSAISQRVKQLEERLGAVLIERGNPCIATEKGAWLCRHMEHVGILEHELIKQLPGFFDAAAPLQRVTLNIATNADSLATWFLGAVSAFTRANDYLLSVAIDDQDHTAEWLQRGRVLAAVTAMEKPIQGCQVTRLGALRYHATASPEYLKRFFPAGVTLKAIAQCPALTFNHKDRLQHAWIRTVFGRSIPYPTHWLPSAQAFVDAALMGMGWCLHPAQMIKEHLASGRLAELVPGKHLDIPLFWQVNRLAADPLHNLTQQIVETARRELVQNPKQRVSLRAQ